MKRDMDLIRKILMEVEASHESPRDQIELSIEGHTKQEISYHVMLLREAGLLKAIDLSTNKVDGFEWKPKSLTWEGHEFLDAARNDTLWRHAKDKVLAATGGLTVELVQAVLLQLAKQALGIGG